MMVKVKLMEKNNCSKIKKIIIMFPLFLLVSCNLFQYIPKEENEEENEITEEKPDYIPYPSGIYSHWKMDETSSQNPVDELGNLYLYRLTLDTIDSETGILGKCRGNFRNIDNCFRSNSFPGLKYDKFIFEGWVKITNNVTSGYIFRYGYGANCDFMNTSDSFLLDNARVISKTACDEWYYFFIYYNANLSPKRRLYINNMLIYCDDDLATSTNIFLLGGGGTGNIIDGYIDDFAYWNNPSDNINEIEMIIKDRWNEGKGKTYGSK